MTVWQTCSDVKATLTLVKISEESCSGISSAALRKGDGAWLFRQGPVMLTVKEQSQGVSDQEAPKRRCQARGIPANLSGFLDPKGRGWVG